MEQQAQRDRPTIEERASKRDEIHSGESDRYTSLIDALSRGRALPPDAVAARVGWHPVLWTLLRIVVIVVVGYMALLFGWRWWRQQQVDTWSGPTATVSSGQRLAGCDSANARGDDSLPTWIRYQSAIYVETDSVYPVLNQSAEGQTQFTETGYSLAQLRIVLRELGEPDGLPPTILVVSPPGIGATVYKPDAACV